WFTEAVVTVHGIYALVGTSLNCLLLYCMHRYTPASFRVFGLLMKWSLLYISYGPCTVVSPYTCYLCYTATLFVYVVNFYITLVSFIARLRIIKHGSISKRRALLLLVSIATPAPVTFAVSFLIAKSDDATMIEIMDKRYPEYNPHKDHTVTGNEDLRTVPMFNVMFIVTILITPLYVVMLTIRSSILSKVSAANLSMSLRTKKMHTQFVHMLTLQAALPLVLILAVFTFSLGQFNIVNHPAIESASIIFGETPSLLSPIIVFCHIPAYRRAIRAIINGRIPEPSELSNPNSQDRGPVGTVITVRSN
ncbi:hypothetical protein PMAYCL1PPCAC_19931, partial [Pristionchus mayeri]